MRSVSRFGLVLSLSVGGLLVSVPTRAGTCTISSVTGAGFGSYDVMASSPLDTTATISYACAVGLFLSVTLSKGSGSYAARTMMSGANALTYNLYMDAAHTVIWGDGTSGTSFYGPVVVSAISTQTLTIYGRLPARQNVPVGSYGDTLTVTLNF